MSAIVIAWIAMDGSEFTNELHRPDGVNWQKKLRTVPKAHAVTWAGLPEKGDMEKAQAFVKSDLSDKELVKIYRYPYESDFLNLAKERIMQEFRG